MKNKIATHFYVKESKKNKNGVAPIYLRITVNGERAEISTNKGIIPELWDKASERVAGRTESARVINSSINNLHGKVEKYFIGFDIQDSRISVKQIIAELKGISQNHMTLVKAYECHIENIEKLVGIEYTIRRYKSSLSSLKKFILHKYNKTDLRLNELDRIFIESFFSYLKSNKGLKQNTAAKDIKNLGRVINLAVSYQWIPQNPFKGFSCNYINPNRAYLTEGEIDNLYEKEFAISRLAKVRDVFIFQIYTGLSYIDMAELTSDSIEIGINGGKWIVIDRQKTGIRSSIPLLPRALEILDKYKNDPVCISEQKLIPVCTNQRMNGYLKEIATICGINKNLTTHLARHTFATTITLSNGVPIETVSKMLGHSDLKTTQIYSKVIDRKIADDMKGLLEKKEEPKAVAAGS
jgi:site-specific recombinase XerD